MLTRLLVSNLTVIDRAELELSGGLTAITGETGAGKTMLTHAVRLVAGDRTSAHLIGPRREEAYVEAEFSDPAPPALGNVVDPDEALVLARRLRREGPTRALASGRACSADQLKAAAGELISLTGQHAARQLTKSTVQLALLDQAGNHEALLANVSSAWADWQSSARALADLQSQLAERGNREQLIRHEVQLIREVAPEPHEQDTLEAEIARLQHADGLQQAVQLAAAALLDSDENPIVDQIARVLSEVSSVSEHDERLQQIAVEIDAAYEQLSSAARQARALSDRYDSDPQRLQEANHRLSQLTDLRRRYHGMTVAEILERCETLEQEIATYDSGDTRVSELSNQVSAAETAYSRAAEKLRSSRQRTARRLMKTVDRHLRELALAGAQLTVEFETATPSSTGTDRVTFLLAANRGLAPAPLDSGASGGEMSRVNLALLLAVTPSSGTFIFDEVDAGIGGEVAHQVAAKLRALAETAQVIVITHLAQIAVHADHHFVVEKREREQLTQTRVRLLRDEDARTRELARLIGANAESEADAQAAVELVRNAAAKLCMK
jgi:DNA repair protein RecN (Recombination protein N)